MLHICILHVACTNQVRKAIDMTIYKAIYMKSLKPPEPRQLSTGNCERMFSVQNLISPDLKPEEPEEGD